MNFIQRITSIFIPSAEAQSRQWVFTCPNCQKESSVWDAGGVRTGAASVGKATLIKCPNCGQKHMMSLTKKA